MNPFKNVSPRQWVFFTVIGGIAAVMFSFVYLGSQKDAPPSELEARASVSAGSGTTTESTPSAERQLLETSYQNDIEEEALSTPSESLVAPADFGLDMGDTPNNLDNLNLGSPQSATLNEDNQRTKPQYRTLQDLGKVQTSRSGSGSTQEKAGPGYGGLSQEHWDALESVKAAKIRKKSEFMAALMQSGASHPAIAVNENSYLQQNQTGLQANGNYTTDAQGRLIDKATGRVVDPATIASASNQGQYGRGDQYRNQQVATAPTISPEQEWHPGELVFGVIDTEVDSDSPSPVRASIIAGPLRGAILLGSMGTPGPSGMVLQFNSISWNGYSSSVNIVAIDAGTARTAMASDIDNHTFSRWGALLLAGAGRGIKTLLEADGSTVVPTNNGAHIVTRPRANATRLALSTIGEASDVAIDQVRKNFERKPTVKIDRGEEVGLMFMSKFGAHWLPERTQLAIR